MWYAGIGIFLAGLSTGVALQGNPMRHLSDLSEGNAKVIICHKAGCSILTEFTDGTREWVWIEKAKRPSRVQDPGLDKVVGSFEQCTYYLEQVRKYPDHSEEYRKAYRQVNCDEALKVHACPEEAR
jgi:hypothetical protein